MPLLTVVAVAFGIPVLTLLAGAFTVEDPATGTSTFGTANLSRSLQDPYLGTISSSVRLSAVVAVAGAVAGTILAQAVITSRFRALRETVLTFSGVLANFGGVPLAFVWIATLGNSGVVTTMLGLGSGVLYNFWGLALVYLYFSVPLMVLVVTPALDGLRPQWREAAYNSGATTWQFWRHVGVPVLAPALLGGVVLLFGGAFAAYATAAAMVGSTVPLVTLQIADALTGDVLVGYENIALALSLDMIVVALLVMAVYLPLQRRSSRWLR
ncbi:putative spermidine/putrescine transport system permease protein [Streptosporangium becharense]|uniref:Putative spermidine/putrescine transport system permease protein n=1 Tax=Streptosporangium becharense TaxID=1816182 RepID=A0A7W9IJP0_9ACTN|nr:ABC transporter permease subunit [Streptosporangium becharense]MBB2910987.1 putative spermidine/putrescine transport system permease protein [Streptosporangium becharense]MBB5821955.1 putative spermidine/putrescine transport system permease protein [Streptosporangium becharense]